jgi:hypothetical protein
MSSKLLRRWPAESILKFGGLVSNYDRKRGRAVARVLHAADRFGDGPYWHGARDLGEPGSGSGSA